MYKTIKAKNGIRYMKDGKFVSKATIPANIYVELEGKEPGNVVDDTDVKPEAPVKECIFCGKVTKLSRFLNMQTIPLCEEHYYSETTGRVVQKYKEKYA